MKFRVQICRSYKNKQTVLYAYASKHASLVVRTGHNSRTSSIEYIFINR